MAGVGRAGTSVRWRRVALSAALGGAGALALVLFVGIPLAVQHREDLPFERAYGTTVIAIVSQLRSGTNVNPVANNRRAIDAGRYAYTGSCATCHGAKGDGRGVFGPATYPPATDLTSDAVKGRSDAQLFWITRNGLSFTAMPGFGQQYSDQDIWSLVSYIREIQDGSADPPSVPVPTQTQLALADPFGGAIQRGAAVYFAQGCHDCHGPVGDAPADLALSGRSGGSSVRRGERGMPAYGTDRISDAQLADLIAYVSTFVARR